jgi:tetratricopeptide (TPR) repeat protein
MRKAALSSRIIVFWLLVIVVVLLLFWSFREGLLLVRRYAGTMRDKEDVVELFNSGNYIRVLTLTESSLHSNPVDAKAHAFAGLAAFYLGLYSYEAEERTQFLRSALYHVRLALDLDSNFLYAGQLHYVLAQIYHTLDEYYANLTVAHLLQAKEKGYQSLELEEYLGIAYIRMGAYEQGVEHLLIAFEDTKNSQFYATLGNAYAQLGKFNDAQTELQRALELSNDDNVRDRIEMNLAKVYYDMGRISEALDLYLMLLRKYPNDAQMHFILGKIYAEEGRLAQARASWMQTLRLDPQNSEAYARLYGE